MRNKFVHILTFLENLQHLNMFAELLKGYPAFSLCFLPSNTFSSSTLTYLCINMINWVDFLCLPDGCLKQSKTLIVDVATMEVDPSSQMYFEM